MKVKKLILLGCTTFLSLSILGACNSSGTSTQPVSAKQTTKSSDTQTTKPTSTNKETTNRNSNATQTNEKTFHYQKEGMVKTVKGDLYKSHAQPIEFYIFKGFAVKMGSDNADYIYSTKNDKNYSVIKAVDDITPYLSDHSDWKDMNDYKGLEGTKIVSNKTNNIIKTDMLIPSKGDRPALKVTIFAPLEMDSYVDYYEMLKTIKKTS